MGYGSYIKNNCVHEWSDYYVKYSKVSKSIGTKSFKDKIISEINKVEHFYRLLENKAIDEKDKIINEFKGDINVSLYKELSNIRGDLNDITETIESSHVIEQVENEQINGESTIIEETDDNINYMHETESDRSEQQLGVMRFIAMPLAFTKRKKEKHITEFLHSLIKIKSYKEINISGISKLIKRHKHKTNIDLMDELKRSFFYQSKKCDEIKAGIKMIYKKIFAKNNPNKAKKMFRKLKGAYFGSDLLYLASGFISGFNFLFALYKMPENNFFALNNIFLGFIMFGFCIKLFKIFKINYKFIFNFDYDSDLTNGRFLITVSIINLIFVLFSIFKWEYLSIIYLGCCIVFYVMPLNILFLNSRFYLIFTVVRACFNPCSTIRFRHFYFVDVFQSFNFTTIHLLEQFNVKNKIAHTSVIAFFPIIRGLQCLKRYVKSKLIFPHIINFIKYLFSTVNLSLKCANSYFNDKDTKWLLFVLTCFVSFFSLGWDIFVDFSLFRNNFMYPLIFYVAITLFDILCRFLFVIEYIHIIPEKYMDHYKIIASVLEISRRFAWTLMRVEVEHLNNCNELKINKALKLTSGDLFYKKDEEGAQDKGFTDESTSTVDKKIVVTETTAYDTTGVE